jgi:hypothetical protein
MRLRELDLDAPQLERAARSSFRFETRSVAALFQRFVVAEKLEGKCWKVVVDCAQRPARASGLLALEVYAVPVVFDFSAYAAAQRSERQELALDALSRGFGVACTDLGWPTDLADKAGAQVRSLGFRNEWRHGASKLSPDKKLRAELLCAHEPDAFRATVRVIDRGGAQVAEQLLLETLPDEIIFKPRLGRLEWVSPTRIVLNAEPGFEPVAVEVSRPK